MTSYVQNIPVSGMYLYILFFQDTSRHQITTSSPEMTDLASYHSCQHCQKFVIDLDNKRPPTGREIGEEDSIFFFGVTLEDVLEGVSNHCQLCSWLHIAWEGRYGDKYRILAKASASRIAVCADSYSMSLLDRYPVDELLFIGLWEDDLPADSRLGKCQIVYPVSLDVFTTKDDPASQFIWTRPINCQPGSPENLALARRWLEECLRSHPNCQTEQSSMPSRILRVDEIETSGEFDVFLENTHGKVEPFAALSYCWGGDQACKTTKARMESGELRLPYEKLARSVQDAVKVVPRLGLKYLWVDALCIIQDDENDKIEQIADMPRIYNQACVTIVAAKSDRASSGFLNDIDLIKNTRLAVKLPFRCPDQHGTLGSAYITYIEGRHEPAPIHDRAWTLQERYLSNRFLEFDKTQMRWTCASSGNKDSYCDGWKREGSVEAPTQVIYIYRELQQDLEEMASRGSSAEWIADWIGSRWETIVHHYTPRKLSVLTDRPLAVSGIAQVFASHFRDDYLAGLWKSTLPSFLCWSVDRNEHERLPRPVHYQGPSWSWTGVNGPVRFILARACEQDCRAVLLDVDIKLVNAYAKYGSILQGILRLRGRLIEATWYRNTAEDSLSIPTGADFHDDNLNEEATVQSVTMYPDADDFEEGTKTLIPIKVSLFQIGNAVGRKKRGPIGLVLHAIAKDTTTHSPTRFKRLGLFYINTGSKGRIVEDTRGHSAKNYTDLFENVTQEVIEIE
ncbi:heterokaryon incompatibility protein-domain-containing protein [Annulohypoxylon truncatum]|uniref:heterokaryon incompatibility protein-domain-containing protein n=1 Tax=Annulohypoxylon truncatum TaxID=327061 RepID=UPI002008867C|nr:heterokaryon incompatibility protein-domain-containing protein [Annulohypoxylon truncatum]KAI1214282.1 heterokaryon incompatibility protein-domain-containing protein [Annulohypoxylon truncatum]